MSRNILAMSPITHSVCLARSCCFRSSALQFPSRNRGAFLTSCRRRGGGSDAQGDANDDQKASSSVANDQQNLGSSLLSMDKIMERMIVAAQDELTALVGLCVSFCSCGDWFRLGRSSRTSYATVGVSCSSSLRGRMKSLQQFS